MRRLVMLVVTVALTAPLLANPSLGSVPMNIDGLTLELHSVERRGNVLTVRWSVANAAKDRRVVAFGLVGKGATTYVVDEENGTKYFTLTDKEGYGLASQHSYVSSEQHGISDYIDGGQTKRYWMKLPAPPPAVKTVNVLFTNAEPFEAVPITDK